MCQIIRTQIAKVSFFLLLVSTSSVLAEPPKVDELDVRLDEVLRRKTDVLVTSSAGIFWSNLEEKKWQKRTLPAQMPIGGKFGVVPTDSEQILYYSPRWHKLTEGQRAGIYGSTDAGQTWQLLSEGGEYGPVAMLENGSLFAVTNAEQINRQPSIAVSRDLGKTWRDISGNLSGRVHGLFPDPDHPGLICVETHCIRGYVEQADDENYEWKSTISWHWHPERREKVSFGRPYSTSSSNNPLYIFCATLRNYFDYDFIYGASTPAIDLSTGAERFTFRTGEVLAVPITIRFLQDLRNDKMPIVEKLIDHPANLAAWGLRWEFQGERSYKSPGIVAAMSRIRDEDSAARSKGLPGFREEKQNALIAGLKGDRAWKTVEFSAMAPYRRMLEIGKLGDFAKPGEYRVQLDYQSTYLADRKDGPWIGSFSSPVFTVVIEP
ncbi:WD40/YVTN/BNR-like repeat-containing protein [Anatilimnocola floriformis]|uniref:WD40/YVTN/BNR-like repeat-containing protein n=1 Tax=Anatilimnocola floriformis TaxID=2948575 RepID=UPI0020C33055|nr:sialidase family protein [Anatilimnocola floriformis]